MHIAMRATVSNDEVISPAAGMLMFVGLTPLSTVVYSRDQNLSIDQMRGGVVDSHTTISHILHMTSVTDCVMVQSNPSSVGRTRPLEVH